MYLSIILEELLIPIHNLLVKAKNAINKNDSVSSKIAINLYKKFGFKIVQTYYWDKEKLYCMVK